MYNEEQDIKNEYMMLTDGQIISDDDKYAYVQWLEAKVLALSKPEKKYEYQTFVHSQYSDYPIDSLLNELGNKGWHVFQIKQGSLQSIPIQTKIYAAKLITP